MTEHSPKVSVVIPLFNKAPYIRETIDSVLSQTFQDFELIIVDDGSIDGSQEVVRSIEDPRIRFYQNVQNMGTARIANKLIDLSKGEYIARLDADDIAPPYRLEKQIAYMDTNPEVGVSSGKMKTFGAEDAVWEIPQSHEELKARILFNTPIYQGAAIIRRSMLVESGIRYDEQSANLAEDWLFWFNLLDHTRFGNIPDVLNLYRIGEQNISNIEKDRFYKARTILYSKMFRSLGLPLEKVDIHFYTKPYFDHLPVSPETVGEFDQWLKFLSSFNHQQKIFNSRLFEQELRNKWSRLFFYLPPFGVKTVLKYWFCRRNVTLRQLSYFLKYKLKNG